MDNFKEYLNDVVQTLLPKTDEEELKLYDKTFTDGSFEVLADIFSAYFDKFEGYAFSTDKGRATARALIKAVKQLKHIPLQYTYIEFKDKGGDLGGLASYPNEKLEKICFWCPSTIATTKDAIEIYYKCITAIKKIT